MALQQINSTDIATGSALGSIGANNITATYLQAGAVETALTNNGTSFGMKNRIINGDMRIDHRNSGSSISSGVGALAYAVDRIYTYALTSAVTAQQVTSTLSGFSNALQITGATGNTYLEIGQRIESKNCTDLNNQTVTVSVYLSSSTPVTVTSYVGCCTSSDNFSSAPTLGQTTFSVTSTPTKFTFTIALNSNASKGTVAGFVINGFTSGTLTITGLQVEKGSLATQFEFRDYGRELLMCQRYCATYGGLWNIPSGSYLTIKLPTVMRGTMSFPSTVAGYGQSYVPTIVSGSNTLDSVLVTPNVSTPTIVGFYGTATAEL
jgi:hypothetical protein